MSTADEPSPPQGPGPDQPVEGPAQTQPMQGQAPAGPGHYGPPQPGPGGYPPPPYGQAPGQYPVGYPPMVVVRTTNGLAIASMVLGILWIYWLGSILALILGYAARKQIRERDQGGDGIATAGIVLGWIGAGVLGVVLAVAVLSLGLG